MAFAAAEAVLGSDAEVLFSETCAALGFCLQAKPEKAIGRELGCAGFAFGRFRLWAASAQFDGALPAPGSVQNVGAGRLPFVTLRASEAIRRTNADVLSGQAFSAACLSGAMESSQISRL